MKKFALLCFLFMLLIGAGIPSMTAAADAATSSVNENLYIATGHENHSSGEHEHIGGQNLMVAMRIAEIIASAAIAGVLFFRYFLWKSEDQAPLGFSQKAEKIILAAAAIIWAVSGISRLWMLSDQLGGIPLTTIATATSIGKIAMLRPAGALLILLLAFAPKKEQAWARPFQYIVVIGLIVTFPLTGHANAAGTGALGLIIAHTVHMAAAAIWMGGLAGLFSLASRQSSIHRINEIASRFAKWALPSVIVIILSACWLTFAQVTSYKQLFASQYGFLILVKVFLLLLIIAIGALHRLWFMPAIEAAVTPSAKSSSSISSLYAAGGTEKHEGASVQRLLAGVRAEIAVAICLLIVAGWLSSTPPPNADVFTSSEPVHWHEMGEESHMTLRVSNGYESNDQLVRLMVWLPEGIGAPVSAAVSIQSLDPEKAGEEPIDVPLIMDEEADNKFEFPGFTKYNYSAKGAFADLLVPNKAVVHFVDSIGNEFNYEKVIGGKAQK